MRRRLIFLTLTALVTVLAMSAVIGLHGATPLVRVIATEAPSPVKAQVAGPSDAPGLSGEPPAPSATDGAVAPREGSQVVVGVEAGREAEAVQAVIDAGATVARQPESGGFLVAEVPTGSTAEALIARLSDKNGVRYVEPDGLVYASAVPNDPYFADQWGMIWIGAPQAWDITSGDASVTIAVIDTGIGLTHPEFGSRIDATNAWDFVNQDPWPSDDNGHGTHVAGIAAAETDNSLGVAGIAGDCTVLPIKVLSYTGIGFSSWVADGITWAADHGASVINLSLGSSVQSTPITDAVNYALAQDCVVVAAAGNSGGVGVSYPAALPGVIGVGATMWDDTLAPYSSRGPEVDITAPGSDIRSVYPHPGMPVYVTMSGTSMATPHVSGAAALLLSQNPTWTHQQVEAMLTSTALDLGTEGRDDSFGYGRLLLAESLGGVTPPPPAPPVGDDDIPGVPIPSNPATGTLGGSDIHDVFSFHMDAGQAVVASMTGTDGTDFDLFVYPLDAWSVRLRHFGKGSYTAVYPESVAYNASYSGTYYIDVDSSRCTTAGEFTLTYEVKDDVPTAAIDTVTPNPAYDTTAIVFRGHGIDTIPGHTFTSFEWTSDIQGLLGTSSSSSFSKSGLVPGTHTITMRARCSRGVWTEPVTYETPILISQDKPTATISSVAPSTAATNQVVTFASSTTLDTAKDKMATYEWTSDKDGLLGTSATTKFTKKGLTLGEHTISLRVKCVKGRWSDPVTWGTKINVVPDIVSAVIDTITPNPTYDTASVSLKAHGTDSIGGHTLNLYEWTSDIQGLLGTSTTGTYTRSGLAVGTHNISMRARCTNGTWTTPVTSPTPVVVAYDKPVAGITSVSPSIAATNQAVTFWSSVSQDAARDRIATYEWTSDKDGLLGTSTTTKFTRKGLTLGEHNISLRVKCLKGRWSDPVAYGTKIIIVPDVVCATIDTVTPNPTYDTASVIFTAHGSDSIPSHGFSSYEWTSDIQGLLGTYTTGRYVKSGLAVGTHTISMRVRCTNGTWSEPVTSSTPVVVRLDKPTAVISSVAPSMAATNQVVTFASSTTLDAARDKIVTWEWTSDKDGLLGTSTTTKFTKKGLTLGEHTISLRVKCLKGRWSDPVTYGTKINVLPDIVSAVIDTITPNPTYDTASVSFKAHGTDSIGGHTLNLYEWTSDIQGLLGTSTTGTYTRSGLAVGTHNISMRARCTNGTWTTPVTSPTPVVVAYDKPVAAILSITPESGLSQQIFTFTSSTTLDAAKDKIVTYEWSSSVSGVLGSWTTVKYMKAGIAPGIHTISLRVKCAKGRWSDPVVYGTPIVIF